MGHDGLNASRSQLRGCGSFYRARRWPTISDAFCFNVFARRGQNNAISTGQCHRVCVNCGTFTRTALAGTCHSSFWALMRRRLVNYEHVDAGDRLQQAVEHRLAEPAAIPGLAAAAHDDVGDAVFLDEGGDRADQVGPLERPSDVPPNCRARSRLLPISPLRGGVDVLRRLARRLHVNRVPGGAQPVGNAGGLAQQARRRAGFANSGRP